MGQYYIICNIDKKEYLLPYNFSDGAKLMEFGPSGSGTMLALAILLADGNDRGGGDLHTTSNIPGRWAGDRIVITGDYADEGKYTETHENLYQHVLLHPTGKTVKDPHALDGVREETVPNPEWTEISAHVMAAMMDDKYTMEAITDRLNDTYSWKYFNQKLKLNDYIIKGQFKNAMDLLDRSEAEGLYVPSVMRTYITALKIRKEKIRLKDPIPVGNNGVTIYTHGGDA